MYFVCTYGKDSCCAWRVHDGSTEYQLSCYLIDKETFLVTCISHCFVTNDVAWCQSICVSSIDGEDDASKWQSLVNSGGVLVVDEDWCTEVPGDCQHADSCVELEGHALVTNLDTETVLIDIFLGKRPAYRHKTRRRVDVEVDGRRVVADDVVSDTTKWSVLKKCTRTVISLINGYRIELFILPLCWDNYNCYYHYCCFTIPLNHCPRP